jgi:RHS repeat-associated protein
VFSRRHNITQDYDFSKTKNQCLFETENKRGFQTSLVYSSSNKQQDILGNVIALTNQEGKIQESISYEVFGLTTVLDVEGKVKSKSISPFLFTGREYDSEIGIYHYRARAYSPILGRFMQLDPIDLKAGDISLVRYVGNNAVNWSDPLGLWSGTPVSPAGSHQAQGDAIAAQANSEALNEVGPPTAVAAAATLTLGLALEAGALTAAANAALRAVNAALTAPAKLMAILEAIAAIPGNGPINSPSDAIGAILGKLLEELEKLEGDASTTKADDDPNDKDKDGVPKDKDPDDNDPNKPFPQPCK